MTVPTSEEVLMYLLMNVLLLDDDDVKSLSKTSGILYYRNLV